jgi:hypothetical protein
MLIPSFQCINGASPCNDRRAAIVVLRSNGSFVVLPRHPHNGREAPCHISEERRASPSGLQRAESSMIDQTVSPGGLRSVAAYGP